MDTVDFIIGTGAYACSMYLNKKINFSETDPKGDDPIIVDPPKK